MPRAASTSFVAGAGAARPVTCDRPSPCRRPGAPDPALAPAATVSQSAQPSAQHCSPPTRPRHRDGLVARRSSIERIRCRQYSQRSQRSVAISIAQPCAAVEPLPPSGRGHGRDRAKPSLTRWPSHHQPAYPAAFRDLPMVGQRTPPRPNLTSGEKLRGAPGDARPDPGSHLPRDRRERSPWPGIEAPTTRADVLFTSDLSAPVLSLRGRNRRRDHMRDPLAQRRWRLRRRGRRRLRRAPGDCGTQDALGSGSR